MNHLAHLYLADLTGTSLAGSLLGDIVRGPLQGRYAPEIEHGIRLHRRVDSYTDGHPIVRFARTRLLPPYRRYAGILLDVLFDHYLTLDWPRHSSKPLSAFVADVQQRLTREALRVGNPGLVLRVSYLRSRKLLLSYHSLEGVERALQGLAARLSRANPLASGVDALRPRYRDLQEDFRAFFPQLVGHAQSCAQQRPAVPA